ncbi:unnamed protein product [Bursaphelenchus xylophilus]|uniref:(pine wood nematode) hypothetical protein n=1 Tax=Bursaphelenchus xylophilus TaxID=6326 RepID=A0A1I7SCM8_BURXY|nr:unnamed protein product [Bursaphelenchus xylophilus]CAG9093829.1 unnamed protein product [Bursaphelenchus xylophilus]
MSNTTNITKLRVLYTGGLPAVNTKCIGYPVQNPKKTCMFPGLHTEIMKLFADRLGLTVEPLFIHSEQPFIGDVENDTVTGLLGYVHNDTVDTIALCVGQSDERRKYFDFTNAVYFSVGKAFLNVPENTWNKFFAFFQSYQYTSWIGIGVALLLQCILCIFVNRIEAQIQMRNTKKRFIEVVWQMLRLQLLQSETLQYSSMAGKFSVVVFSLVQCTVVMGVLSSYIYSNLVRPKPPLPFKTFSQFTAMMADRTLHLVELTKASIFYDTVMKSNASDFTRMRHAFSGNPLRLGTSIKHVLQLLDEPGAVLLRYEDEHLSFEAYKKCNIYMTDMLLPPAWGYFVFKKGFPFMDQINQLLERERYKIDKLWNKYLRIYRSQVGCIPSDVQVIGAKYPYIGTAITLFVVELIAIALFFGEVIIAQLKRRNRR